MIKVFYDGLCHLCDGEVNHYKKMTSQSNMVEWIDITDANFDAQTYNLKLEDLNAALHLIDDQGTVHTGVNAFVHIWNALPKPYPIFAKLIKLPVVYQVAQIAYVCFAKIRVYLPKKNKQCAIDLNSNSKKNT